MSKTMNTLHVILMLANWLICLGNAAVGNFGAALLAGIVAAVLTWQLTW